MPLPTIGVPMHIGFTNPAFYQAMQSLQTFGLNLFYLDCRYKDEEHLNSLVLENMDHIDGLLLPGSMYDIDPKFYHEEQKNVQDTIAPDGRLAQFQLAMIDAAFKRNMPILGICAGSNMLHIYLGGKINQNIRDQKSTTNHDLDPRSGDLAHSVTVDKQSHLYDIIFGGKQKNSKTPGLEVNSWHHTANIASTDQIKVSALAPDGVVEAIEPACLNQDTEFAINTYPNCWGIQFHPEYLDPHKTPEQTNQFRIIEAFKTASLSFHSKRDSHRAILNLFNLNNGLKYQLDQVGMPQMSNEEGTIRTAIAKLKK